MTPPRRPRDAAGTFPGAYGRALEVAIEAARAASSILSAEFARPEGPRGGGDKCPADDEAEAAARAVLLGAFPDFGFVAEEDPDNDRPPSDEGRHAWVVDPNDGTRYFLRGRRGASVSVGLLRAGLPVLGVVLAHSAPHGGEDLICWAEGLPAVLRNGAPVVPSARPDPLTVGDLVLVSPSAEAHPLATGQALTPARFLPVASIAYRLALVAAGEARAAISLQPLDGHDVAAGHALIRGAGLRLVDAAGEEVRYQVSGKTRIGPVAAGPAAVVIELATRLGQRWEPRSGAEPPAELVEPRAGRAVTDAGLLRRAQGALLGQLCGDALGSFVEFQSAEEIAEDHPDGVRDLADGGTWKLLAGQPTDDSELALALARALVRRGGYDPVEAARAYAGWFESQPFDIGRTTRTALAAASAALRAGRDPAAAARAAARTESKANGSLMRISPLGVFGHRHQVEELMALAREDARLTHPNPVCLDASALFAATVALAVRRGGSPAEVADAAQSLAREAGLHGEVVAALEAARTGRPDYATHLGLVTVALQNAFFQLRHATLEEGLIDTVRRGGDTDTNAAIAGALLGAVHGVDALPRRWRSPVLTCFPVHGLAGCHRPRPPACWPVDALVVAERLVGG